MIAAVLALSILVARDVAADGWILTRALEASARHSRVPTPRIAAAASRLWLRWTDDDGAPARIAEHRISEHRIAEHRIAEHRSAGKKRSSSSPPVRRRLELATRHYADAVRDLRLEDVPVDSASWLYGALVEAALRDDSFADRRAEAERRARSTLPEVPEAQRLDVFAEAAAAFLGHALSVVHEIARHERRRRSRGSSLCGRFDVPSSLFGLWRGSIFGAERYTGFYRAPGPEGHGPDDGGPNDGGPEGDGRGSWVESRSALSVDDRRWLARALLDRAWTGEPAKDFAWVCAD